MKPNKKGVFFRLRPNLVEFLKHEEQKGMSQAKTVDAAISRVAWERAQRDPKVLEIMEKTSEDYKREQEGAQQ